MANRIAAHQVETNHRINWEGATCIDFNVFGDVRMFIENWFSKSNENSINICRELLGAYTGLIKSAGSHAFERTRELINGPGRLYNGR